MEGEDWSTGAVEFQNQMQNLPKLGRGEMTVGFRISKPYANATISEIRNLCPIVSSFPSKHTNHILTNYIL